MKEIKWRKRLDTFIEITTGFWIFIGILYIYEVFKGPNSERSPCQSYLFLATEMISLALCLGFIIFGYKVTKIIRKDEKTL